MSETSVRQEGPVSAVPQSDEAPRVLVAICHNVGVVDRQAAQSLIGLGWGNRIPRVKADLGIAAIDMAWYTSMPCVDALRNAALEQAMRDGFTHVVFLDADMIFPDDLFARLLRHIPRGAVVSGFYTQRRMPYGPVALREGRLHASGLYRQYRVDADYADVDADGLRAEEVVGMGCALIPLAIVQALGPRPWFEYRANEDGWPMISEDVPFCEKVRAAGFPILLDPSIRCGHLFTAIADEQYFARYREVLAATEAKLRDVVTLTVEETPAAVEG
jgi:hypothetical protein